MCFSHVDDKRGCEDDTDRVRWVPDFLHTENVRLWIWEARAEARARNRSHFYFQQVQRVVDARQIVVHRRVGFPSPPQFSSPFVTFACAKRGDDVARMKEKRGRSPVRYIFTRI